MDKHDRPARSHGSKGTLNVHPEWGQGSLEVTQSLSSQAGLEAGSPDGQRNLGP